MSETERTNHERIKQALYDGKKLTKKELSKATEIPMSMIGQDLDLMFDTGALMKCTIGKEVRWMLADRQ